MFVAEGTFGNVLHIFVGTLEDRAGTLWVGTEGGGLERWNPGTSTFDHYQRREDDATSLLGSSVRTLRQGVDGRLWIGTWDGGLSRLDPATGQFERFPELADSAVNALLEDSQGRLWVGTGSVGLALLKSDRTFTYTSKKEGLAGDTVTGVIDSLERFRSGDRDKARLDIDRFLPMASPMAAAGQTMPQQPGAPMPAPGEQAPGPSPAPPPTLP